MSFCAHCKAGHILPGEPNGSFHDGAYYAVGTDQTKAVILLTDAFGLPMKNCKIMADQFAEQIGCDVWVPDICNGNPLFKEEDIVNYLPDQPGIKMPFTAKLGFLWTILTHIPQLISNRPSVLVSRTHAFIRKIKEERSYDKIGAVGYCLGGAVCVRLASSDLINAAVVAHPGRCTDAQFRAIKVPTAWICAEEDMTFGPNVRANTEAIFAARKDKSDFVDYEFHDYKGTVHGFAARPNLGIPEVKEAFENAFSTTVQWFKKYLF